MANRVELEKKAETVDVKIDGKLFTTYHFGKNLVRPFLNPLIGPGGQSLVRELFDKPEPPDHDHIHHRGILVAHGDVNGVDDWSEEEGHGWIKHESFEGVNPGNVYGLITGKNSWVSNKGKKVLSETREMKFYADARNIDFKIIFKATEGDVKFGDTKEGGILSLRVATPIRADRSGKIENGNGGVGEKDAWGKRAEWCDYSGPLGSKVVGIAVFDHPSSFRHPTYWHVRNYGLMTANPFGLSHFYSDKTKDGSHILEAGEELKFQFRLYIHEGNAAEGKVGEAYENYVRTVK